jgi:hypothetical protein
MLCLKIYNKQKIQHKKIIASGNVFNWNVELDNVLLKLNDKYPICQQIALMFLSNCPNLVQNVLKILRKCLEFK